MRNIFKWLANMFVTEPAPVQPTDSGVASRIKGLFLTYFDGVYDIEPQPNTSNTYAMGVCKLDYNEKDNELTVHLRRPGLLIGKAGCIIDALSKYLDCKIKIVEVNLQK